MQSLHTDLDLEKESESEFPKLQPGACQTLAKKTSSCVLQLFCLVKIIMITPCFQKESGPPPVAGVQTPQYSQGHILAAVMTQYWRVLTKMSTSAWPPLSLAWAVNMRHEKE